MDPSLGYERLNQQFCLDGNGQFFSSPMHGLLCAYVTEMLG